MNIQEFFDSPVVAFPKERVENDFEVFLTQMVADYLNAVDQLDPACPFGSQIRANRATIERVGKDVCGALNLYFTGRPARAYTRLRVGIRRLQDLDKFVSIDMPPNTMPPMYRMAEIPANALSQARMFHVPFELRHLVGRHRYGTAGFPCLYLGGSLQICRQEIEIPPHKLHKIAIARFGLRQPIRLLDFGYRPALIGNLAQGRLLNVAKPNPAIDQFIVNYAICWPLIAACSIKRKHGGNSKFAPEYVLPQLVLQWVMEERRCDGLRYCSTWVKPDDPDLNWGLNYVFPALPPPQNGHSQRLRDLFEMTQPCLWNGMGPGTRLWVWMNGFRWRNMVFRQFQDNTSRLLALPLSAF